MSNKTINMLFASLKSSSFLISELVSLVEMNALKCKLLCHIFYLGKALVSYHRSLQLANYQTISTQLICVLGNTACILLIAIIIKD